MQNIHALKRHSFDCSLPSIFFFFISVHVEQADVTMAPFILIFKRPAFSVGGWMRNTTDVQTTGDVSALFRVFRSPSNRMFCLKCS